MVSAVISRSSIQGLSPSGKHCVLSLGKTLNGRTVVIVALSAQVCKQVPTNLMLRGNPAMDQHPIQEEVEILLVTSCYGNWDKLQPCGPLVCRAYLQEESLPPILSCRVRLKKRSKFVLIIFYLKLINSGHADISVADKKHGKLWLVLRKSHDTTQKKCPTVMHFNVSHDQFETNLWHQKSYSEDGWEE